MYRFSRTTWTDGVLPSIKQCIPRQIRVYISMPPDPVLLTKSISEEEPAKQSSISRNGKKPYPVPLASQWSLHAANYRHGTEEIIFPFALMLADECHQVSPLDAPSARALDNGTGTGAITAALKSMYPSLHVIAADVSQGMIDSVTRRINNEGWENVEARVLDARKLEGIEDASLSHVLSTFMVCLTPEPKRVVAEMSRVTRPGGVLGLGVWADPYFGAWNTPWTKACRELDPGYQSVAIMDEDWTRVENVEKGLKEAGYVDVGLREMILLKKWGSLDEACDSFWNEGNPGVMMLHDSWKADGRPPLEELKPGFRRHCGESLERDGKIIGEIWITIGTARKPG